MTDTDGGWTFLNDEPLEPIRTGNSGLGVEGAVMTSDWIVLPMDDSWPTTIYLFDARDPAAAARLRITIEGIATHGARLQGDRLTVFGSDGRLLTVSLPSGAVLFEHRLMI